MITNLLFSKASALYDACDKLMNEGISLSDDTTGTIKAFNSLVQEHDFSNVTFTDEQSGLMGVKWCDDHVMIPAIYDSVKCFTKFPFPKDQCFTIASRNGKDYLINSLGKEVFEADEIKPYVDLCSIVSFRNSNKWGIRKSSGTILLPAKYDSISFGSNGFIFLSLGEKKGFIADSTIIEPQYDNIEFDEDDNLVVTQNGQKGFIDENGRFTTEMSNAYYNLNMFL